MTAPLLPYSLALIAQSLIEPVVAVADLSPISASSSFSSSFIAQTTHADAHPEFSMSLFGIIWYYRWVFVAALAFSLLSTPILRSLAISNNIVDRPDEVRKHHRKPIAYLGGVAIFFGWLAGIAVSLSMTPHPTPEHISPITHVAFPTAILIGAIIIVIVGLLDDIYAISPRVKVGGQMLAAAWLATQDVGQKLAFEFFRAGGIDTDPTFTYILGAAIIAIFVIGGCNAVNLLDGLDGLAAGVTAIACVGFLILAGLVAIQHYDFISQTNISHHIYAIGGDPVSDPVRIVMGLALIGALLGFLVYNFNPASIFMGDTGSLLLGFLAISTILLFAHTAESGPRFVVASLVVFGLPITDTLLAIIRRTIHGHGILSPDNQHLHHKLIRMGLSVKQAVITLYIAGIGFAALGCSLSLPGVRLRHAMIVLGIWLFATFCLGVIMGIRRKRALASSHQAKLAQTQANLAKAAKTAQASASANALPPSSVGPDILSPTGKSA